MEPLQGKMGDELTVTTVVYLKSNGSKVTLLDLKSNLPTTGNCQEVL
jgi:hypothetical protein